MLRLISHVSHLFRIHLKRMDASSLSSIQLTFAGLVIPTHLVIVTEFNITIIAASLVVMRPCLHAIYIRIFPKSRNNIEDRSSRQEKSLTSVDTIGSNEKAKAKLERKLMYSNGILMTTDIELASRSISAGDTLVSNDPFG